MSDTSSRGNPLSRKTKLFPQGRRSTPKFTLGRLQALPSYSGKGACKVKELTDGVDLTGGAADVIRTRTRFDRRQVAVNKTHEDCYKQVEKDNGGTKTLGVL